MSRAVANPPNPPNPVKSTAHLTAISKSGALVLQGGHRARCACGWWSDCYAQLSDTERAIEVHLRKARRSDIDDLIARSSIGTALADVKKRGIDAHLADLERAMKQRRPRKAKRTRKLKPDDAAFMRGFGVALAAIWHCQHDAQLVRMLLKENSFTLDSFRGVDLLEGDFEAIQQAVRR